MSSSALTIPGKWNSFNSSTVDHLNKTKQSNIPSPGAQRPNSLIIKNFDDTSDENLISVYSKDNKLWFKPGKVGKSRSELEMVETNEIPKRTAKQSLGYKFVGGRRSFTDTSVTAIGMTRQGKDITHNNTHTIDEYKGKLKKLEREKKELMKQINTLYNENKSLRRTLESLDEPGLDSYSQIVEDRKLLRNAEDNYKKRIAKLEKELKQAEINVQTVKEENGKLKEMSPRLEVKLENQSKFNNIYWKWNALVKENEKLQKELNSLKEVDPKLNTQIMLGRAHKLDFLSDYKLANHKQEFTDGQLVNLSKYCNIYEERNSLKTENIQLKRDNVKLTNQITRLRKQIEKGIKNQTADEIEEKADIQEYPKMYANSSQKAQLYKRISELEHEITYFTISNRNLLSEVNKLQSRIS